MIESKDALIERFLQLATQFEQSQNPVTGIDLDDATVALKRYLLSKDDDQETASLLNQLGKLVRSRDMPVYTGTLAQIRARLGR